MARGERDGLSKLAERWTNEAVSYEQQAKNSEYTAIERRLLEMHARVKRADALELKNELARVRRD